MDIVACSKSSGYTKNIASKNQKETMSRLFYHYCNLSVGTSILTKMVVWFSHARFLNDYGEFGRGHELMLRHLRSQKPASEYLIWHNRLLESMQQPDDLTHFVGCFSTDENLLSQWRSYADDGTGLAIGFDANVNFTPSRSYIPLGVAPELIRQSNDNDIVYDEKHFLNEIDAVLTKLWKDCRLLQTNIDEAKRDGDTLNIFFVDHLTTSFFDRLFGQAKCDLFDLCILHKSSDFSNEAEVRSYFRIQLPSEGSRFKDELLSDELLSLKLEDAKDMLTKDTKYRAGKVGIVPYVEMHFQPSDILKVVIGPKANDCIMDSLEMMKKTFGYNFDVEKSKTTYR